MTETIDPALVAEATKKAAIVWLTVGDHPAYPVWCAPTGDALHVVTGPGEQPAPGLLDATTVQVSARGDHGGRIVTWTASVVPVEPASDDWPVVATQLAGKRLNAAGTVDDVVARWARECAVLRLAPTGEVVETVATTPATSEAAPPRPIAP
jgi:hypothetical protein